MTATRFVPRSFCGDSPTQPFATAEEAWFWFARCQIVRRQGARFAPLPGASERPCDPDDIYRAAVSLKRKGLLGRRHLAVLGHFGVSGRPPDPRCREEEEPARLWEQAIDRLTTVLQQKGIVA